MSERDWYEPYSYEYSMQLAEARLDNEAWEIERYGGGAFIKIVGSDKDQVEVDALIRGFAAKIGFNPAAIEHFDVGMITTAFELNIDTTRFDIPQEDVRSQNPAENIFQYIYQDFGKDGGWRIGWGGIAARVESSRKRLEIMREMASTPFGNFIRGLDLQLDDPKAKRRFVVLDFPSIEDLVDVKDNDDVDWTKLTEAKKLEIAKILTIYSTLTSPDPTRIRDDNPHGHIVICNIDPLYKWFLVSADRSQNFLRDYERLSSAIFLPSAHERDMQLLRR